MKTKTDLVSRFWKKVDKTPGCWLWTACKDRDGYGIFRASNASGASRCNRIVWTLCFGPIPKGKLVLHTCNNRACCNPEHLILGTQKDNMAFAAKCGRMQCRKGEMNGRSKLTEADVRKIRSEYWSGDRGVGAELAKRYRIHRMTLYRIVWCELWPHIK
jgi:hypothetical protein